MKYDIWILFHVILYGIILQQCTSTTLQHSITSNECTRPDDLIKNNSLLQSILVCVNADLGRVNIQFTMKKKLENPLWRVRASGANTRIAMLEVLASEKYADGRVWNAYGQLCGGHYYIEPLLLFSTFRMDSLRSNCIEQNARLLEEAVRFLSRAPNCTHDATGWWVLSDRLAKLLSHTRIQYWTGIDPAYDWTDLFHETIVDGRVLENSSDTLSTIPFEAPTHRICLFGDSQLRTLNNDFVRLLGFECADQNSICTEPTGLLAFTFVKYGGDLRFVDVESMNCTHVIANIGQWHASWAANRPTSPTEYRLDVMAFLNDMLSRVAVNTTVWFLSTNPSPYTWRVTNCPADGWRHERLLGAYYMVERHVVEEVQRSGEPVYFVDTFKLLEPVLDLSYDHAHFMSNIQHANNRLVWRHLVHDAASNHRRNVSVRPWRANFLRMRQQSAERRQSLVYRVLPLICIVLVVFLTLLKGTADGGMEFEINYY